MNFLEAIRTYREEESRYKSDRQQIRRVRRVLAAKLKSQQLSAKPPSPSYLPVVDAYARLRAKLLL